MFSAIIHTYILFSYKLTVILLINDTKGLLTHVYVAYMFCVDRLSSYCIIIFSSVRYTNSIFFMTESLLSST